MVPTKNKEALDKFVQSFFTLIKDEMKKQNISHNEMVNKLGCTNNHFNRLVQQKKMLSADKMVDMATGLNLEIEVHFRKDKRYKNQMTVE